MGWVKFDISNEISFRLSERIIFELALSLCCEALNHEQFFATITPGGKALDTKSKLHGVIVRTYGTWERFKDNFCGNGSEKFRSQLNYLKKTLEFWIQRENMTA